MGMRRSSRGTGVRERFVRVESVRVMRVSAAMRVNEGGGIEGEKQTLVVARMLPTEAVQRGTCA